jgi:hypothetical protein
MLFIVFYGTGISAYILLNYGLNQVGNDRIPSYLLSSRGKAQALPHFFEGSLMQGRLAIHGRLDASLCIIGYIFYPPHSRLSTVSFAADRVWILSIY